jgi:hypothetical protein
VPSVRLASALWIGGTAILLFLAVLEYRRLVDYCEDTPEVLAGGDALSCLEPQHWLSEAVIAGVLLLLEIALLVVFGAALRRRKRRPA